MMIKQSIFYCLFLLDENITIRPVTEAATKITDHKPALNMPAIAEQPATKIRRQANINSTRGFMDLHFSIMQEKLCRNFFQKNIFPRRTCMRTNLLK